MQISEITKNLYLEGYNCTESILHGFKNNGLIDIPSDFLKIAAGFRAGIAGSGCVCGVLSAGTIVIGLKYGRKDRSESNKICDEKVKQFYEIFKKKYSSTCCRVITKKWRNNFNSEERRNYCAEIIKEMAEELEKLI